jgi:hypothetical protein
MPDPGGAVAEGDDLPEILTAAAQVFGLDQAGEGVLAVEGEGVAGGSGVGNRPDGTGVPVRASETAGRAGKGEDGQAGTREVKLARLFTVSGLDDEGRPRHRACPGPAPAGAVARPGGR